MKPFLVMFVLVLALLMFHGGARAAGIICAPGEVLKDGRCVQRPITCGPGEMFTSLGCVPRPYRIKTMQGSLVDIVSINQNSLHFKNRSLNKLCRPNTG